MKRRREHGECETREGGRGCLVFGTKLCTFRKAKRGRWQAFREKIDSLSRANSVIFWALFVLSGVGLALGLNLLMGSSVAT